MLVRRVRRKLFDIRLVETTELFAIWKITPDGQVRRPVLSRDRRDTGSLVSAGESSARPSRVSQKSAQKCQHEQNRSATNAGECNWYDHGRCCFPWTKRPWRCLTESILSAIPAIPLVRTKIDFGGRLVDKYPRRPIWWIVLVLLAQSLRRVRVLAWFRQATFPNCAPVLSTLTLALELSRRTTHASATLGAYPVKNAGNDVFTGLQHDVRHLQFSSSDSCTSSMRPAHFAPFSG
jgi:hypothetical protein